MTGEHYFTAEPSSDAAPGRVTFALDGREYTLATAAGVFSGTRLDPGTGVLVRSAPPPATGTLLDLGCGYGPIACVLAVRQPRCTVWAVDVNARARDLTATNAATLRVADRVSVAGPDDVPADLMFDEIWSNPPIRIGKAALHDLLATWLARLVPGGQAWLVVARNLGSDSLQRWLQEQGWPCDRFASARGYRVLRVHQPAPVEADQAVRR